MSAKYWAKLCLRIFMLWSGGFHRFSMICSMAQDGRQFFSHCQTVNTASFLEHGQGVQGGGQDGPDTRQGAVAHIQGCRKILCRSRHYCSVVYHRTSISESRRGSMERTLTCNESSIRYADKDAHLAAVYEFIRVHKFDYNFKKFWKRKPPKGIMRPFIKMDGQPNPDIVSHQVSSKPAQKQ